MPLGFFNVWFLIFIFRNRVPMSRILTQISLGKTHASLQRTKKLSPVSIRTSFLGSPTLILHLYNYASPFMSRSEVSTSSTSRTSILDPTPWYQSSPQMKVDFIKRNGLWVKKNQFVVKHYAMISSHLNIHLLPDISPSPPFCELL